MSLYWRNIMNNVKIQIMRTTVSHWNSTIGNLKTKELVTVDRFLVYRLKKIQPYLLKWKSPLSITTCVSDKMIKICYTKQFATIKTNRFIGDEYTEFEENMFYHRMGIGLWGRRCSEQRMYPRTANEWSELASTTGAQTRETSYFFMEA